MKADHDRAAYMTRTVSGSCVRRAEIPDLIDITRPDRPELVQPAHPQAIDIDDRLYRRRGPRGARYADPEEMRAQLLHHIVSGQTGGPPDLLADDHVGSAAPTAALAARCDQTR